MQLYLPIAEVSVNIFLILGLGGLVGVLSGMFGVGGGFAPLVSCGDGYKSWGDNLALLDKDW